jgi:hypothetical protein
MNSANGKQLVLLLALLNSGKKKQQVRPNNGSRGHLLKFKRKNAKPNEKTSFVHMIFLPTSGAPRNLCVDILTTSTTTKRGVIK